MRDDLGNLAGLHAVIEREVEIGRHLDGLAARDQGGERNDASVSCRQARAFPDIAEKTVLCVLLECRRDHPHILKRQLRLRAWRGFYLVRLSRC